MQIFFYSAYDPSSGWLRIVTLIPSKRSRKSERCLSTVCWSESRTGNFRIRYTSPLTTSVTYREVEKVKLIHWCTSVDGHSCYTCMQTRQEVLSDSCACYGRGATVTACDLMLQMLQTNVRKSSRNVSSERMRSERTAPALSVNKVRRITVR
jgi:hypothetical protein